MTTRISALEADGFMREQGYAYLDVRSVMEFEAGHPLGAFNVPWQTLIDGDTGENPRFVDEVAACFARDGKLVVGCKAGARSELAAQALLAAGFVDVVVQ